MGERKSTLWTPQGVRLIVQPSDIKGCACARFEKFHEHLSKGCAGLGLLTVTSKTYFNNDGGVIRALFHLCKATLLAELRVCPVEVDGVMRLKVCRDDPEKAFVAATLRNLLGVGGRARMGARRAALGAWPG